MLNDDIRKLARFVDSGEAGYARCRASYPPKPDVHPTSPISGGDEPFRADAVAVLKALGVKAKDAEAAVRNVVNRRKWTSAGELAAFAMKESRS